MPFIACFSRARSRRVFKAQAILVRRSLVVEQGLVSGLPPQTIHH